MANYLFVDGACLKSVIAEIGERYAGGISLEVDYATLHDDGVQDRIERLYRPDMSISTEP